MKVAITKSQSSMLYIMKAFAILCVAFAHCGTVNDQTLTVSYFCSTQIRGLIAACGVSIFMILSGFFFYFDTKPFKAFFINKIKKLFLPWIITGTLVYLYVAIRKGGNLQKGIGYVFGYGSYLWYMAVLFVLYIVFFFGRKSKIFLYIVPFVSVVSYFISPFFYQIINIDELLYLNFINWSLFFWIGFSLARFNLLERLIQHLEKFGVCYSILWLLFVFIKISLNLSIEYWSIYYVPYTILAFIVLLWISRFMIKSNLLINVGKDSFCIYLIHMPIAGLINAGFQKVSQVWILIFICPFVVICICELFIYIFRKIMLLLPDKLSVFLAACIGLR